mmetsp:Transcript_24048/g.55801  ORF Transcript_24048/g.55801 Transcript_24048/m.55801 type:complete len:260 (-) Transcript_24048:183-962(-)
MSAAARAFRRDARPPRPRRRVARLRRAAGRLLRHVGIARVARPRHARRCARRRRLRCRPLGRVDTRRRDRARFCASRDRAGTRANAPKRLRPPRGGGALVACPRRRESCARRRERLGVERGAPGARPAALLRVRAHAAARRRRGHRGRQPRDGVPQGARGRGADGLSEACGAAERVRAGRGRRTQLRASRSGLLSVRDATRDAERTVFSLRAERVNLSRDPVYTSLPCCRHALGPMSSFQSDAVGMWISRPAGLVSKLT